MVESGKELGPAVFCLSFVGMLVAARFFYKSFSGPDQAGDSQATRETKQRGTGGA